VRCFDRSTLSVTMSDSRPRRVVEGSAQSARYAIPFQLHESESERSIGPGGLRSRLQRQRVGTLNKI
jgi:hypothetical protein